MIKWAAEWIVGTFEFCKLAGWRGALCEIFNIDSNHREDYQWSLKEGMSHLYDPDGPCSLDEIISHLKNSPMPSFEPYRTRRMCSIRGFEDAKKARGLK